MARGHRENGLNGAHRIYLDLNNHACKICKSKGNLIATGQKIATISSIDFLAVCIKCTYCIAEYLLPILSICTNEVDAQRHWDFVCKMEKEEEE